MSVAVSEHPMELPDEAFWADTPEAISEWCARRGAEERDELLLDGPTRVSLESHKGLTLHAVRVGSLAAVRSPDVEREGIVVAIQSDTHMLRVARAFPLRRTEIAPRGDDAQGDADSDEAETFTAEHLAIDARRQLALPWVPAPWEFVLLVRDRRSNRTRTRVVTSLQFPEDPEAARFIAEQRALPRPEAVFPPEGEAPFEPDEDHDATPPSREERLPDYVSPRGAPPIPSSPGLVLAIDERVTHINRLARLVVRGSFLLPLLPRFRVPPPEDLRYPQYPGASGERPVAVIPVDLVLLGDDVTGPVHLPLRVPVRAVRRAAGTASIDIDPTRDIATNPEVQSHTEFAVGRFAVDLFAIERMPRYAQRWSLHAFAGGHTANTLRFTLSERVGTAP